MPGQRDLEKLIGEKVIEGLREESQQQSLLGKGGIGSFFSDAFDDVKDFASDNPLTNTISTVVGNMFGFPGGGDLFNATQGQVNPVSAAAAGGAGTTALGGLFGGGSAGGGGFGAGTGGGFGEDFLTGQSGFGSLDGSGDSFLGTLGNFFGNNAGEILGGGLEGTLGFLGAQATADASRDQQELIGQQNLELQTLQGEQAADRQRKEITAGALLSQMNAELKYITALMAAQVSKQGLVGEAFGNAQNSALTGSRQAGEGARGIGNFIGSILGG